MEIPGCSKNCIHCYNIYKIYIKYYYLHSLTDMYKIHNNESPFIYKVYNLYNEIHKMLYVIYNLNYFKFFDMPVFLSYKLDSKMNKYLNIINLIISELNLKIYFSNVDQYLIIYICNINYISSISFDIDDKMNYQLIFIDKKMIDILDKHITKESAPQIDLLCKYFNLGKVIKLPIILKYKNTINNYQYIQSYIYYNNSVILLNKPDIKHISCKELIENIISNHDHIDTKINYLFNKDMKKYILFTTFDVFNAAGTLIKKSIKRKRT